jgi:cell division protease FtsH
MIINYGMSDNLGNMVFNENDEVFIGRDFGHTRSYSEEVAAIIDKEVKHLIDTAYERTILILKENINVLHRLAEALLEKEKLEGHEFEEIFARV